MQKDIENIIEDNSMEYSAYILTNRVIPDLRDSCKPVVRRIIYTMHREKAYKFTKSATMSGKVMAIHPHSDCYPTMVGMVQKDAQVIPWLEGKGNFSQHTSRDLMYASSRYSEVKLSPYTIDVLKGLNDKSVRYVPNYDGTIMIPEALPVKFPMILHYCQMGIGYGMSSNIPSFNMIEVSNAIEKYVKTGVSTPLIPDFATGGIIVNNKNNIEKINDTGLGSIILRGKCNIDGNYINITEIPFSTTREAIIDKIIDLAKNGKMKEVVNINDSTGLNGMCIKIECKKNTDMELLIQKLYAMTPLQSSFSSNMNVLSNGLPKVMGVWQIVDEWLEWRKGCVASTYLEDIKNTNSQLHLYEGLIKIIDFIDEVIAIVRTSKSDNEMISSLSERFDVSKTQAEYIADIKLRNLNTAHINKLIKDKEELEVKISKLENILNNDELLSNVILSEIKSVSDKYGKARLTEIIDEDEVKNLNVIKQEEFIDDFNHYISISKEGYLYKYLRSTSTFKLKDGDEIINTFQTSNKATILVFTNKGNCHKIFSHTIDSKLPSQLGYYLPSLVNLQKDESIVSVQVTRNYEGNLINIYEGNKLSRVDLKAFKTEQKRMLLKNSLSLETPLIRQFIITEDIDILVQSSIDKVLICNTSDFNSKSSKNANGDGLIKSKNDSVVKYAEILNNIDLDQIENVDYYRGKRNGIGKYIAKTDKIIKL